VTTALDRDVGLLERALGYTRLALVDVSVDLLDRSTPCAGWSLEELLAHMEDALDAFLEAASGVVAVRPAGAATGRVGALQEKACALLGAFSEAVPERVVVGGAALSGRLLVTTAALEITIHGWDVAQSTGRGAPIPASLAGELLTVAHRVIDPADRGPRFARPLPVAVDASPEDLLLAFVGRDSSGPPWPIRGKPGTAPGLAS
jgi:uncharacterized protein (TIGR03086 family)